MLENFRDTEHERAVHAFLLEYLVDVGARAAQLPCESGGSRNLVGIAIQLSDSEEEKLFVHDSMQVSPE